MTLPDMTRDWHSFSKQLEQERRVLIVEDSETIAKLFLQVLKPSGFQCDWAKSGEEGVEMLERSRYTLLVLDKNLPGMNGIEFLRHAKKQDPECEALIVTAYSNLESVLAAIELRACDYLTKPLPSIGYLPAALERASKRRRRRLLTARIHDDLAHAERIVPNALDLALLQDVSDNIAAFDALLAKRRRVLVPATPPQYLVEAIKGLSKRGFQVFTEESAEAAFHRCRQGQIAVLIASDGFARLAAGEVMRLALEIENAPEVVAIVQNADHGEAADALRAGAASFKLLREVTEEGLAHSVERAWADYKDLKHQRRLLAELNKLLIGIKADNRFDEVGTDLLGVLQELEVSNPNAA